MNRLRKFVTSACLFYLPLIIMLAFILIPFLWTLSTSLKNEKDVLSPILQYIPHPATFQNYIEVWKVSHFSVYFINSLFVSSISVIAIILLSVLNGYALTRFNFRGKRIFMIILLCTQLLPAVIFLIPLFLSFKVVGLIDTPFSLIIFYIAMQVPFNTLLMKGFIGNIPKQIDEAGMVDGATRTQIIFKIILPLVLPGLVATAAFAFVGCWNEFIAAFTFITSSKFFTIPVGLKFMIGEYDVQYASLAAGSIIGLVPAVLLFAYVQKYLIQGLGSGSVKG
ncbi:MAG TPA: transporter [Firmicutes bacterium]|jgi:multiple sugar transport system permease protein|nr:transporter [Bacillota bacterium]